jgi:hypothetical protein
MLDSVFSVNRAIRERLAALIENGAAGVATKPAKSSSEFKVTSSPSAPADRAVPMEVVVTLNEINNRHGTGPLVKRVFQGHSHVFSIRSRSDWGVQDFGAWNACIPQQGWSRAECFCRVLSVLRGRNVRSVLCIPFLSDELITAIAAKECFDAALCAWIMDDQNVATHVVPDDLMRELLEKCSLRLVTHPELRFAYERKYGLKFYLLPAIVPDHLVSTRAIAPFTTAQSGRRGALIGSFWDQSWFDRMCEALEECHCQIDWFGNNKSPWLQFPEEALRRAGITPRGILPEEQLALELRKYPFVIVPVGALDGREFNTGVAWLSLPGRILFTMATAHTPILVVGSGRTCGARFVSQFGIGEVVPYNAALVSAAMDRLVQPEAQSEMRHRAAAKAQSFSDRGVADWVAESLALGRPVDSRFEDAFAGYDAAFDLPAAASDTCLEAAGVG